MRMPRWWRLNSRAVPIGEIDEETKRKLESLLRTKRLALLGPHGIGRGTTAEKLNRKRHARSVVRALRKKLFPGGSRRGHLRGLLPEVLLAQYRENPILDQLISDRKDKWRRVPERRRRPTTMEVNFENFSFTHNPVKTLLTLKHLAEVELVELSVAVNFRDHRVTDIGPYLVLTEIWPSLAPVFSGGEMHPPVQKVIEAVRLRRRLRMAKFRGIENLNDVWAFPVQRRHGLDEVMTGERLLGGQQREKVADDFCDWVDDCLGVPAIRQRLTVVGRSWVARIIGELLDNAERHSAWETKDGSWSLAGFMARRAADDGREIYILSLAFVSVGASISESLSGAAESTRLEMDAYCSRHSGNGISESTLRTVYAMQDYVTRDRDATKSERGGIGFQDVLELASELGKSNHASAMPRFTMISGSSCIYVGYPYIKGEKSEGEGRPRQIWFNGQNSADFPPSNDHVYDLSVSFPGTVISLWLTLDPINLNSTV